MNDKLTTWKGINIYKIREQRLPQIEGEPDVDKLRQKIEPWLTALFQSEHLSLLVGAGISSATHKLATGTPGVGMSQVPFSIYKDQIAKASERNMST